MRKPRKPYRQCFNCIDYDPGALGSIFPSCNKRGYCVRFDREVLSSYSCKVFRLSPVFWDRSTTEKVRREYGYRTADDDDDLKGEDR
jgi:hypothetical protein